MRDHAEGSRVEDDVHGSAEVGPRRWTIVVDRLLHVLPRHDLIRLGWRREPSLEERDRAPRRIGGLRRR
jgi:hypothetical protein